MIYKESLIDILEQLVASIPTTVTVNNSVDNLDGTQTISVCDALYAQVGFQFTIGPDTYTIIAVDQENETITVSPAVPLIVATSFSLYAPYFFHGTPIETSTELDQNKEASTKTPMVYLLENFSEEFNEDEELVVERESRVRLFFLTQANFAEWTTDNFYDFAIVPMRRLMENFFEQVRTNRRFDTLEQSFTATNHIRFGVYISNRGVEKSLFVDNLSGVEMEITLTILKDNLCPPC